MHNILLILGVWKMAPTQARIEPNSDRCAKLALARLPTEYQRRIRDILESLYLGYKIKEEDRRPLEEFFRHYLACELSADGQKERKAPKEVLSFFFDEGKKREVIARIMKSIEADGLQNEKARRRPFLLTTPLAVIYRQFGGGFFEKAVGAITITAEGADALIGAGEAAADAAGALGGRLIAFAASTGGQALLLASKAAEKGGTLTRKTAAAASDAIVKGSALAAAAAGLGFAAVYSTATSAIDSAKDRIGMKDVLYIVQAPERGEAMKGRKKPERIASLERALKSGREERIDRAIEKILILELNLKRGKALIESPEYRYFIEKAQEGVHVEALSDSLARIRWKNPLLREIADIIIHAIRCYGCEEAKSRTLEALGRGREEGLALAA